MWKGEVDKKKVKRLVKSSHKVFDDVAQPNGAIIAAPSGFKEYPPGLENYNFVWVRDAAFVISAATLLGKPQIAENFFRWMLERAENFAESGFMANAYAPHGPYQGTRLSLETIDIPEEIREQRRAFNFYGLQFQPDQYGHLLWAVHFYLNTTGRRPSEAVQELVRVIVNGLREFWDNDHFTIPYFNLWEDYIAYPQDKAHFAYTLAIIWQGLEMCSSTLKLPKEGLQLKEEFKTTFHKCFGDDGEQCLPVSYLYRGDNQEHTGAAEYDAVLAGLCWPARAVGATDKGFINAIREIENENKTASGGLKRHPEGGYSGRLREGQYIMDGEGAWPILHFWFAILWNEAGDREKALHYFNWVLERTGRYLPEQIFDDPDKPSITPLAWSHAMFVFAAYYLGFLK